jgi:hypothetical protein
MEAEHRFSLANQAWRQSQGKKVVR